MGEGFGLQSFEGKVFLDVGCGSGLASFAALNLNASRVISFDFQEASVDATTRLRHHRYAPGQVDFNAWSVQQGSILDEELVASLVRSADLVYSYGVLHTTGDVWQALKNVRRLVRDDGLLYVLVHARERQEGSVENMLSFKKEFNDMVPWQQEEAVLIYAVSELMDRSQDCLETIQGEPARHAATDSKQLRFSAISSCLQKHFKGYASYARGMDFIRDAHDWLGGYPYEWVFASDVISFMSGLQMKTLRISHGAIAGFLLTPVATGSHHYLADSVPSGHWVNFTMLNVEAHEIMALNDFKSYVTAQLASGNELPEHLKIMLDSAQGPECFVYFYPSADGETCRRTGDSCMNPDSILPENMNIIGWGSDSEDGLFCKVGAGARYRMLSTGVIFSTADGSDPRTNGRSYQILKSTIPAEIVIDAMDAKSHRAQKNAKEA